MDGRGALDGVRVVFVNNFPGPGMGGGEHQTLAVIRATVAAGAETTLVAVAGSGLAAAVPGGVRVVEARMGLLGFASAVRAVEQQLGDRTVVVGTGYFTGLVARRAARSTGARVVTVAATSPDSSLADGGSAVGLALRRFADRVVAPPADAIVAVADSVAKALVAGDAPEEHVLVIRNGVDVAAIADAAREPFTASRLDHPLVVCVARLAPVKGVEHLVRAAPLLPGVSFAIAGTGPEESRLRELASALGVSDRVSFLGYVNPVAPLLASADLVVLPSLSEGLPMTALEAMALARPVVASRVGGLPEVVESCETGLLVKAADQRALVRAIKKVLGDAELARSMGEAGRARVEEHFTEERMSRAYVELFAGLARS